MIAAAYRLWKCTGGELDDLGIASINEEYNGGRDFWFERIHPTSNVCEFLEDSNGDVALNLTFGTIPYSADVRSYLACQCKQFYKLQDSFANTHRPFLTFAASGLLNGTLKSSIDLGRVRV